MKKIVTTISIITLISSYSLFAQERASSLLIPPVLEYEQSNGVKNFNLETGYSTHKFSGNVESRTLGYNNFSYLGPTIIFKKGDNISLTVSNKLRDDTTLHWHGGHINAFVDGNQFQVIPRNESWTAKFRVDQQASTTIYHPHPHGDTASQFYLGLAGLIVIEDEFSQSLNIPKEYGVDDIPLVIQDKRLTRDRRLTYNPSGHDIFHNGITGNVIITNGAINPTLNVTRKIMRFRIVNGSNASFLSYNFSDKSDFYVIAGDNSFLEKSVKVSRINLSPAERVEILVDFSSYKEGDVITLDVISSANLRQKALTLNIGEIIDNEATIPDIILADKIIPPDVEDMKVSKVIDFESLGMRGHTINRRSYSPNRVDIKIDNDYEIWEINNAGGMMGGMLHNFHIHGYSFKILSYEGAKPASEFSGWKDTLAIYPGDSARVLIDFSKRKDGIAGVYPMHCHILEHEESGMMTLFEVES